MRQEKYILERAAELKEPVAVFLTHGRIKIIPASSERLDKMLEDRLLGGHCIGVYNKDCPEEWLIDDIRKFNASWFEVAA